jgi:regulation of enolase protein 1 (concanavalin A-like superfamily)
MTNSACTRTVKLSILLLLLIAVPLPGSKLGIFNEHQDVGSMGKKGKGKAKYDRKRDAYTVTGSGANIWGNADAFQFVYEQVSGDVTLTTKLNWVGQGKEAHRKAGLMLRQSLTPDSAYADVMVHGDGLTSLQYREATGDATKEMRSELKGPSIVRIERHGDQITMAVGETLEDLKTTGPITLHLQDPLYLGLAVCSHNAEVSETAIFKGVKITTAPAKLTLNFPLLAKF